MQEKKHLSEKGDKRSSNGVTVTHEQVDYYDPSKETKWTRRGFTVESLKRAPASTGGQNGNKNEAMLGGKIASDDILLQQKMKDRHVQMIAGFVLQSAMTIFVLIISSDRSTGGPAALIIAWSVMGIMLVFTMQALGEMAILYPVSGGFYTLVSRFVDPSWGFAMGWNYTLQWCATLPLELTAAALTVRFWDPDHKYSLAIWITVFMAAIFILNIFPTGYAEEEYWTSIVKLITVAIFFFASLVFVCGGGPSNGEYSSYVGGKYWSDPGAFAYGFHGFCSVFVTAAFSYSGTELVGLAAAEHPNARRILPSAVKMTFWRIICVYIITLLFAGLLIPWNSDSLLGASDSSNTSPFVLVWVNAGVQGGADFMNAVICMAVLSIGMSSVYGGSRVLLALSEQGYAPKFFRYVDKAGRPSRAMIFVIFWYPIAYASVDENAGPIVLDWLIAVSGLSVIFTWMSINIAHLRFRKAWRTQGHHLDELPFRSIGGEWGSMVSICILTLFIVAQFYVGLFPIGGVANAAERANSFFQAFLAAFIMLICYLGGLWWKPSRPAKAKDIDLVTGRKCFLSAEENNAYRDRVRHLPVFQRLCHTFFGFYAPYDDEKPGKS